VTLGGVPANWSKDENWPLTLWLREASSRPGKRSCCNLPSQIGHVTTLVIFHACCYEYTVLCLLFCKYAQLCPNGQTVESNDNHRIVSIITLAASNRKRNITAWCPSVRPFVRLYRLRILNVTRQGDLASHVEYAPTVQTDKRTDGRQTVILLTLRTYISA